METLKDQLTVTVTVNDSLWQLQPKIKPMVREVLIVTEHVTETITVIAKVRKPLTENIKVTYNNSV